MRIIGGTLKGLRLNPPHNLPVRPTTDMAKEALFNILTNRFHFEHLKVLDLFSGTGNISFEFASRGTQVVSVDKDFGCVQYLKKTALTYHLNNIKTYKSDVFKFLKNDSDSYDIIFADAPYDLPGLVTIPAIVFEKGLLKKEGLLIVEHPSTIKLDQYTQFTEQRKYGYSSFSFFENKDELMTMTNNLLPNT
ncbi:RsmD family RNA methyltransferase [Rubrolithibacter danxiaensis]|uniref:RsmD family RNA methyltransferase n=1 Tax=Rubrolithibacter danxiaensis TaxID=3390805 RepID=UPI003BF809AE